MEKFRNEGYLTFRDISYRLDISEGSLRRYFWWYNNPEWKKPEDLILPKLYQVGSKHQLAIKLEDLHFIQEFREKLRTKYYGIMGEFHAVRSWGKRGKEILDRNCRDYGKLKVMDLHSLNGIENVDCKRHGWK